MNLWVARGPAARAEARISSAFANWFISTKTSGPVNGEVQDSNIGSYELTRSRVRIDKYHAMALFAATGAEPPRFDARPAAELYTGREVVSLLLAGTPVNYRRAPSSFSDVYAPYIAYDPDETFTVVEEGRLVRGVLDKKAIGAKATGGIPHLISRKFGPHRALAFIYALQQVALQFLLYRGFTVGVADLLPDAAALEGIRRIVAGVELEARVITERLLRGEIVAPIGATVREHYEKLQREALKPNESEVLRFILGSARPDSNGMFKMVSTGAKGSNPNLIHVSGVIGQTTINGERLAEDFAFRRTSPYYPRFSTAPGAYGFVGNSYMTGMDSAEFIAQDMNGRFDLINKALSTSSTGYFMRKNIMNNQSAIVDNRRGVTKDTRVVQFLYGEDACDSRELERVSFATAALSDAALAARCGLDARAAGAAGAPAELAEAQRLCDAALAKIREDRDAFRRHFLRLENSNFGQTFSTELLLPVSVGRIVEGVFIAQRAAATAAENAGAAGAAAVGPADTKAPPLTAAGLARRVERVWGLCARLPYALLNEVQERRRAPIPAHLVAAAGLLCMQVRAELCPAALARLSDEQLEFVGEAIRQRYALSLIHYGTAAGILAAQAISEPLTQYMLDSHHRSVAGGTNKSGLIRVAEIYGAKPADDEQSPAMQLPLRPEALGPPEGAFAVAQEIANSIESVTLGRFVRQDDLLLEPYGGLVYPPFAGDAAWIAEFERAHPLVRPPADLTNWCIRFLVDKNALVLKATDLELIVTRLRARHPGFYVVHTPEAVPDVVIRVWARASLFRRDGDAEARARDLVAEARDTPIRGIRGVLRASAERVVRHRAAAGGELLDADSRLALAGPPRPGQKTTVAEAGQLIREERYMILTVGTNLYGALLHAAVDSSRAITSSIGDTRKLLGIEAARAKIVSEIRAFMEDGTPNLRHLFLNADEMTRTGTVTSVERGGLAAREPGNVLLRMAYGAPVQVVTEAAVAGVRSKVYGPAATQILGGIPRVGTQYNTLVADVDFIRENSRSVDRVLDSL